MSKWTNEWMDKWADGRMDGWTDGRMDGWTGRCVEYEVCARLELDLPHLLLLLPLLVARLLVFLTRGCIVHTMRGVHSAHDEASA